jgi:homopolymeric O-antigen transport system ATP-binding protein
MSDVIIQVENLGKKYRIRHQAERQRYKALRDMIADATQAPARNLWSAARALLGRNGRSTSALRTPSSGSAPSSVLRPPPSEDFWALRNVSFEVKRGEVLGIIGRNGAGKSTLLKILSRITEATEGRVILNGRVASLLEVGTGFHPELTGRENIFLNGAILGMARAEIRKKFDDIVAFAEVEKFLDTPVKRYSSGMYVRLAFAVAAHLDPEILIVDEVLSVGDASFQRKCLGKMNELASGGSRTVLFVSHNQTAVARLCSRVVVLENGMVAMLGSAEDGFARLTATGYSVTFDQNTGVGDVSVRRGDGRARYTTVEIRNLGPGGGRPSSRTEKIEVDVSCKVLEAVPRLEASLLVRTPLGSENLMQFHTVVSDSSLARGVRFNVLFGLDIGGLAGGDYPLYLWLGAGETCPFDVLDGVIPPLHIPMRECCNGKPLRPKSAGCLSVPCDLSVRRI